MACAAAPWWRRWSMYRRTVQLVCLALFAALVVATATSAAAGYAVPALAWLPFRLDPLVVLAALVAGTATLGIVLWGLAAVALGLLFGRAFCGWICPLGTLMDGVRRLGAPFARRLQARLNARTAGWLGRLGRLPLAILVVGVLTGALGLPLLGLLQPQAIAERAAATAVTPWVGGGVTAWRDAHRATERAPAPGFIDEYRFIGAPVRQTPYAYPWGWIGAAVLGAILLAEAAMPRFWCRTVCPTGAGLGLLARWSLVQRMPGTTCGSCRACVERCHLGAFTAEGRLIPSACTACMSCLDVCPSGAAQVRPAPAVPRVGPDITRRGLLAAGVAGAVLPLTGSARGTLRSDPHRLRPPGAGVDEGRFLEACVRCGACVQACPTHALVPAQLQDGLPGLFAPRLVPRQGPCEHACQACAAVCPTHAIPLVELAAKFRPVVGTAVHHHGRCIPWSGGGECRVCWEHCPVEGKAITLKLGRDPKGQAIPMPGVDADQCVGCGTCEFVCPIEGEAGIRLAAPGQAAAVRARLQHGVRS